MLYTVYSQETALLPGIGPINTLSLMTVVALHILIDCGCQVSKSTIKCQIHNNILFSELLIKCSPWVRLSTSKLSTRRWTEHISKSRHKWLNTKSVFWWSSQSLDLNHTENPGSELKREAQIHNNNSIIYSIIIITQ